MNRIQPEVRPYGEAELLSLARRGFGVDPLRALATFAEPNNWARIYDGKMLPTGGKSPMSCEWVFIGPTRPPYELAQWGLKTASGCCALPIECGGAVDPA